MLFIRACIHKMLVRIVNREDPDQMKQYDLGLHCLSRLASNTWNYPKSDDLAINLS